MGSHGFTGAKGVGTWGICVVAVCWLLCANQSFALGQTDSTPKFRLTKTAGEVTVLGADRYAVPILIKLRNIGSVAIDAIEIEDDLAAQLYPATVVDIEHLEVLGGFNQANAGFDGVHDTQLLAGHQSLPAGTWGKVRFTLVFAANGAASPLFNLATTRVRDPSTHKYDSICSRTDTKDADVYGCEPTPIHVPEPPVERLGVAKSAGHSELQADRSFTTELTFKLRNYGDLPLQQLQLADDLSEVFQDVPFEVLAIASDTLAVNANYNGREDIRLLNGTDHLGVNSYAYVRITVNFAPFDDSGTFLNTAIASTSNGVIDNSTNGPNPDPNGDHLPDESIPTPITYLRPSLTPARLGLAKAVDPAELAGLNTFVSRFTLTLRNYGEQVARQVNVQDDLAVSFASAVSFAVVSGSLMSDTLAVNPGFDGVTDLALLASDNELAGGAQAQISFSVRYTVGQTTTALRNIATATGDNSSPDDSTPGDDPDPNDDGDPDENGGTGIPYDLPVFAPLLGLAKQAGPAELIADDAFRAVFLLTLENLGNGVASNVNIVDDLGAAFATAADFSVEANSLSSPDFAINPTFDGLQDQTLLLGTDDLAAGQQGTVSFAVIFSVDENTGTLSNLATATGANSPPDDSTPGDDPDPNDDGDPDENGGTEIPYDPPVFAPRLGLAKQVSQVEVLADGGFRSVFQFTLENLGDGVASNVNIEDDLGAAFASAVEFSVEADSLSSQDFAVNPTFDGQLDRALLLGADNLAPGAQGTVSFAVRFSVDENTGTLSNLATATGDNTPPDDSTPGDNPDPNGDGDPDENGATDIPYEPPVFAPRLGLAKQASQAELLADASFRSVFLFTLKNLGDGVANNVNIIDDLGAVFASAEDFAVEANSLSSADFAINPTFDGLQDQALLLGTDGLAPGQQGTVSFAVRFTVTQSTGTLTNLATATGDNSPPDDSTPGDDPDPNGDGDPGENGVTEIPYEPPAFTPRLGLAKQASQAEVLADGSFRSVFQFTLENFGAGVASNVNIVDDLVTAFAGAATFSVEVDSLSSPDFAVNPTFDGQQDQLLLLGTDDLAPGAQGSVSFAVRFTVTENTGTLSNLATATGDNSPPDDSTPGDDPDPNDDGNPDENGGTDIPYEPPVFTPRLGLAKQASQAQLQEDDRFRTQFVFTATNYGDATAVQVNINDDLAATFASALSFAVVPGSLVSDEFTVSTNFDGTSQTALLQGVDELLPGATGRVAFDVLFAVSPETSVLTNLGTISASNGPPDTSTPGTDPDPDNDGNPDENGGTNVPYEPPAPMPAIVGLAKAATAAQPDEAGGFITTLTFNLANLGQVPLTGLQLLDDLALTFPQPAVFEVIEASLASDQFAVNTSYDGGDDSNLLNGTDVLDVGATGEVSVALRLWPQGLAGPFSNIANVRTNEGVQDTSTDGINPDPNNDGDPVEDEPTLIELVSDPQIGLSKAVTQVSPTATGYRVSFLLNVENLGDVALSDVQVVDDLGETFPAPIEYELVGSVSVSGALSKASNGFPESTFNLLATDQSLAPGAMGTIEFALDLTLSDVVGPFDNQARATGISPGGQEISDISNTGLDPKADGETPTPIPLPGGVRGTVFLDEDHDRTLGSEEQRLPIWSVELLDAQLNPVDDIVTNTDGSYLFSGIPPGMYSVQFRHPDTDVVWGRVEVVVVAQQVVVVDLPVDPQGVVYDAQSREAIPGARVGIATSNGNPLAEACLLPNQQNQIVGPRGFYRFTILHGADDTLCPATPASYVLSINAAPERYVADFAMSIEAEEGDYDLTDCSAPCLIQQQTNPPGPTEETTYFESYSASSSTQIMINNHLPIDRVFDPAPNPVSTMLDIDVRPNRNTVRAGAVVGYTITVTNLSNIDAQNLTVIDTTAPGLQALPDTAQLVRPGGDGIFGTVDDTTTAIVAQGVGPIGFAPFPLPAGEQAQIIFVARVNGTTGPGLQRNTATATEDFPTGTESVQDSARVTVIADPLMDKATLLGKVFIDRNGDGKQHSEDELVEPGLPGIRLITPEGLIVETDADGRFHVADIDVPARGGHYVIKLDTFSLPEGATVTSDLKQIVRIMPGGISKVSFAVTHEQAGEDCCGEFEKLYSTDPFRAEKKLDVALADVALTQTPQGPQQVQLGFDVYSNYYRQAKSYSILLGDAEGKQLDRYARHCFTMRSERQIENIALPPKMVGKVGYVVRAYAGANCSSVGLGYDQTDLQLIDLEGLAAPIIMGGHVPGQTLLTRDNLAVNSAYRDLRIHRREDSSEASDSLLNDARHFAGEPIPWQVDPTDNSGIEQLEKGPALEVNFEWQGVNGSDRQARPVEVLNEIVGLGVPESFVLPALDGLPADKVRVRSSIASPDERYQFEFEIDGLNAERPYHYQVALHSRLYSDDRPLQAVCLNATVPQQRKVSFPRVNPGEADELRLIIKRFEGPNCDVIPGTRLARTALKKPDQMSFSADGTTTYMDCCEIPTALRTFLDDNNEVTTLRVDNLVGPGAPADRKTLLVSIFDPSGQGRSEVTQTLAAGQSVELILGNFLNGPLSKDDWSELRVQLENKYIDGDKMYYLIERERGEDDTFWRPPIITAHCFNVDATPLIENDGVAALLHDTDEQAEPVSGRDMPPIQYGVGVIDLTVGGYSQSRDFEQGLRADGLDKSDYVEGRVAAYMRGRKPMEDADLTWTVQLDSTKDELSNLLDNLQREDPRRLFRQLDGDHYYPTYGDDSTVIDDTNSQGAIYAKVAYGDSSALWGNYNTGFTTTEFAQYNRSLYGLNAKYAGGERMRDGQLQYQAKVFASQAQSVLSHAQFNATGGSLYYLRHTDIVLGSEKVWVEVRRRDAEQIEERHQLVAGRDYEVDALQGRILLQRPLSQVMQDRHNSVIQSSSLAGDEVFLLVDYEYVPSGFAAEDYVYGARLQGWFGDELALGLSHVNEDQGAVDYQLTGVDAVLHLGNRSYVSAEYAYSEAARLGTDFSSFDGGLTFDPRGQNPNDSDGRALGFEAQVDLRDFDAGAGQFKVWWKERARGYSSSQFALGPTVRDTGLDFELELGDHWKLMTRAGEFEELGVRITQTARVQMAYRSCGEVQTSICNYLDVEAKHEDTQSLLASDTPWRPYVGDATILGIRLGRDITPTTTVYGAVQESLNESSDYAGNSRVAVGVNSKVSDKFGLSMEASEGDRGEALLAGIDYTADARASFNVSSGVGRAATTQFASKYHLREGQELYGSYTVDPDRSDSARNMLTFGHRSDLGMRTRIFTEAQFGKDPRQSSSGHILGLEYDAKNDWVVSSTVQRSTVERETGDFERTAVSVGTSFQNASNRFSARAEVREDTGDSADLRQYILSSALTRKLDDAQRLLAKLNVAWLDDDDDDRELSRFVEFNMGYAYRPIDNDRFNFISRYGYLLDVGSIGQIDSPGDERSHVLSMEGIYDLNETFQFGGKLAGRKGQTRLDKGQGDWYDLQTGLATARLIARLPKQNSENILLASPIELVAEYRWLRDFEAETLKQGALLGLYKQIDGRRLDFKNLLEPSIRVGVGFNFSGFDDDMRGDSYKARGWFIDMMAVF